MKCENREITINFNYNREDLVFDGTYEEAFAIVEQLVGRLSHEGETITIEVAGRVQMWDDGDDDATDSEGQF